MGTSFALLSLAAAAGMATAVVGQAPNTTPPPPSSAPRDPLALPGDNLPPPLAAAIAPPRAPRTGGAPPADEPPPPGPPMDAALRAAQAALAQCRAQGHQVGVAVANSLGVIVVGLQADGAHPGRIYNAMRKNLVAIEFGERNSVVRDRLRAADFATLARVKPNMTLFPGAVPLTRGGKLIGAIAVSGGPAGEIDEGCAAAGAAAFQREGG